MAWSPLAIMSTVGLAAFLCGVALFYLVMNRTRKHRDLSDVAQSRQG
jgi:hypothetical protein